MSALAVIEVLLALNMAAFMVVFSLLAQPPALIRALSLRVVGPGDPNGATLVQRLIRRWMWGAGVVGCISLFGLAILTSFVITLYREGMFWRL